MKDEGSNTEPTTSENPVKRWLVRNKVYISWGVLALLVGYVGVASILAFAGQKLPMVTFFTVEVLDNQAKGAIVTAAVSWVAGIAALFTFFLNRDQKEKHLQKQLEQDAKQAELQRLEKLFGDLAEDFASDVVLNRINAAIGLSEIAQTPDPRSETKDKTKENYPYFLRAADRLAAALHQWGEQPARDEVRKALTQLAAFAKDEGTEEPLLHALCNSLADANRTALGIFVETMAEGLSAQRPNLKELADLCEFLGDRTGIESCLKQLSESLDGKSALRRWKSLRRANDLGATSKSPAPAPATHVGLATDFYLRFARASQALLDARDALAGALRQLSKPLGLPEPPDWKKIDEVEAFRNQSIEFSRRRLLNLKQTFLAGADLYNAQMQGASLFNAYLQKAVMSAAQLQAANVQNAHLQSTSLNYAKLQIAKLIETQLQGAYLWEAELQCADLGLARLEHASLEGANLEGAEMKGTQLFGAHCGQNGRTPAVFSPGGWVDAEFRTLIEIENGVATICGEEDTVLKNWLMANYPPDIPPSPE